MRQHVPRRGARRRTIARTGACLIARGARLGAPAHWPAHSAAMRCTTTSGGAPSTSGSTNRTAATSAARAGHTPAARRAAPRRH